MRIVAVDPGSRTSGIVVRDTSDDQLVRHLIVERDGGPLLPSPGDRTWAAYTHRLLRSVDRLVADADLLAVEATVEPKGFASGERRPISFGGLMGTTGIVVVLLTRWPSAEIVEPAGFGSLGGMVYPEPIRPPEGGAGGDKLRHCRSAWDLSHAAESTVKRRRAGLPG